MFKRKLSLLIILLFVFSNSFSQSELTENQKLFSLAKVWGFLKYYHPDASEKNMDWDKELFIKIQQLDTVTSVNSLNLLYINWINGLGKVPISKTKPVSFDNPYFENISFSWIDSLSYFSPKLKAEIKYIKDNKIDYENKYAPEKKLTQLPDFKNELTYGSDIYVSKNYKLLTLFRFWNIIEYFSPNKSLFDEGWDTVLSDLIPKFIKVNDINSYDVIKQEMIACIDDTHSFGYSKSFFRTNNYFTAFGVEIIQDKALVTSISNDSICRADNIKLGDAIYKINNKPTLDYGKSILRSLPASNVTLKKMMARNMLLRGNSDTINLSYIRGDLKVNNTIKRFNESKLFKNSTTQQLQNKEEKSEKWSMVSDNIGYVNLISIENSDIKKIFKDFSKTNGIILDLRNYPKQLSIKKICKKLYPEKMKFIYFTKPNFTYPGNFEFIEKTKLSFINDPFSAGEKNEDYYKGKVVILVDEHTQSMAEYYAQALRNAPNAAVVGSQTGGAVVNPVGFLLPDGQEVFFTAYGAFDTEKKNLHRIGVVPDFLVEKTIEDPFGNNYIKKAIEVIIGVE